MTASNTEVHSVDLIMASVLEIIRQYLVEILERVDRLEKKYDNAITVQDKVLVYPTIRFLEERRVCGDRGELLQVVLVDPTTLQYDELRPYISNSVFAIIQGWAVSLNKNDIKKAYPVIYQILYYALADVTGWDVYAARDMYVTIHGRAPDLVELVDRMGYLQELARILYSLFGQGQRPMAVERAIKPTANLVPIGIRAGTDISKSIRGRKSRADRRTAGQRRKKDDSITTQFTAKAIKKLKEIEEKKKQDNPKPNKSKEIGDSLSSVE